MPDPIIRVTNLSKRYRIGTAQPAYGTLRESIMSAVRSPLRNFSRLHNLTRFGNGEEADSVWALRDVSFDVAAGEVLGIIGNNGSGKSTLLKILTRITDPTSGSAEIHGRVSSLLEVGTGFHPELTGRENIFLNGSLLGMRKREIEEKFDQIVSFAEIEKFLDTPVKRYSSGMYVRLAFAVAAHLDPEIMLVDEVLAVGDIAFQKKCLGRMQDVARGGRTVLFVSHNMGAIRSLCHNAIWLERGGVVGDGLASTVVEQYEEQAARRLGETSCLAERSPQDIQGRTFFISRVEMQNESGQPADRFRYGEQLFWTIEVSGPPPWGNYSIEFRVYKGDAGFVCMGGSGGYYDMYFDATVKKVRIDLGPLTLTNGLYTVSFSVMAGTIRADTWDSACSFRVYDCQPFAPGREVNNAACIVQHSFFAVKGNQQ